MRFQVPQFTEVEDKIVGPLTFKQFIYVAGAIGACIVLYSLLPLYIAIFFMLPIAVLGGALAFYKVNNRPFIRVVESFTKFTLTHKLYIWKHSDKKTTEGQQAVGSTNFVPKLSESKLRDLTWSLDVKGNPQELKNNGSDELSNLI